MNIQLARYIKDKQPPRHVEHLQRLKEEEGFEPRVIYDVGSCVLTWQRAAKHLWPEATVYCVEGTESLRELYQYVDLPDQEYHMGIVSDVDGREVTWWESPLSYTGNSYYRETGNTPGGIYKRSAQIFTDDTGSTRKTLTLDTIAEMRGWPKPDLVKIDVQGADVDVVVGAPKTLANVQHLLVELAKFPYNEGVMLREEAIPIIESRGFQIHTACFDERDVDADYDFVPRRDS